LTRLSVPCARPVISDVCHRAGGHWRSHAAEADLEQLQWDMETYNHWLDVIEKERNHAGQTSLSRLGVSQSWCFVTFALTEMIASDSILLSC
jgi:hypothetical protein